MTKAEFAEYEEAYRRGTEGFTIVAEKFTEDDEDGDGHIEPHFSRYPCGICRRPLGGDRYEMILTNPGDAEGDQVETTACTDCLYYSVYGTLDDMTMMDMED